RKTEDEERADDCRAYPADERPGKGPQGVAPRQDGEGDEAQPCEDSREGAEPVAVEYPTQSRREEVRQAEDGEEKEAAPDDSIRGPHEQSARLDQVPP